MNKLDAIIIGAGFSGLYQLHCLREKLGLNARILEAGSGIGGTWHWNRYPGARCDSESQAYCYTFSRELTEQWDWSERYPGAAEIRRYLNHVVDHLDLAKDITLNSQVVRAEWNNEESNWVVTTADQKIWSSKFLICAVGCLSTANIPAIPGLDSFKGSWYHTGQWPEAGVDFTSKRVGQIGTGSTGIQSAPVIASSAEHLTVFQRTANYSVPARNVSLTEEQRQAFKDQSKEIRDTTRSSPSGHPWHVSDTSALAVSADDRNIAYENAWKTGGLRFRSVYSDLTTNAEANETAATFICNKIRQKIQDPKVARSLTNIDHPYGAKRPPIDTHYFEMYNRDNVTLVDLQQEALQEVTTAGIRTDNREYPLDIIVFATGFDALTGALLKIDPIGCDGKKLSSEWSGGPRTYLGLQSNDFPNLFTVTGPGSPCVLTNMPAAIEQHVEWISDCIQYMLDHGYSRVKPSAESVDSWSEEVQRAANATLLPSVKHSWYLGANVPGKPQVFMPYAGGLNTYRKICNEIAKDNYRGFSFD